MLETVCTGRKGERVRSDVHCSVTRLQGQAREIIVRSRVKALYGRSLEARIRTVLEDLDVQGVRVEVDDAGALDFVLTARLEAALHRLFPESVGRTVLPVRRRPLGPVVADRPRRSRLYIPGDQPKLMINAGLFGADGIILDLEDAVAPERKEEARYMVRNALLSLDFGTAERMVRINPLPAGLEDLKVVLPGGVDLILVPKVETAASLRELEAFLNEELPRLGGELAEHRPFIMPILETARGIMNADEIAGACPGVVALTLGLEDLTADMGVVKTPEGQETLWARSRVVMAACAHGLQAIDSVYGNIADEEGLRASVVQARAMGFVGKGCVHPRQIPLVNNGFQPDAAEIAAAGKVVLAFEQARAEGRGVVALGNKMIDPPVVARAQKLMARAEQEGLVAGNWREQYGKA